VERLPLVEDVDPSTGRVRGVLCDGCKRGFRLLGDNREAFVRAIEYLDRAR